MSTALYSRVAADAFRPVRAAAGAMRTRRPHGTRKVAFAAYVLDREDRSLWKGEQRLAIPPKEFELLDLLTRHAGRLVEKQEILSTVWAGTHVSDAVVKVCVRKLRLILEDSPPSQRFIETVARRGYRFVARVEPWHASGDDLLSSSLPLVASEQAGCVDLAAVLARSVDLARERASAGRYDEAILHFKAALKTAGLLSPQEPGLVHDLRLRMSEAAHRAGREPDGRAVLLEALTDARAARDPARFASAVLALSGAHQAVLSGDRGLVDLLEEALESLPPDQAGLRACIEARLAYALARFPDRAERKRALLRASRARGRSGRTLRQEALILRYRLWGSWGPDDLRFRLAGSRRLESYASRLDDHHVRLYALGLRTACALEAADAGLYERSRTSYLELADESGCRWTEWSALRFRVMHATLSGRFAEAQELIQGGVELTRSLDHPDVLALLYGQRMILHIYEDRTDEILPVLGATLGSGKGPAAWRCVLTYALARAGDRAGAERILGDLARDGFAAIPRDSAWISCMTLLGDACVLLRDRSRAREVHALLLPHERQNAVAYFGFCCLGPVHGALGRLAGLIGRREAARRHHTLAELMLQRLGAYSYQSRIAELHRG